MTDNEKTTQWSAARALRSVKLEIELHKGVRATPEAFLTINNILDKHIDRLEAPKPRQR